MNKAILIYSPIDDDIIYWINDTMKHLNIDRRRLIDPMVETRLESKTKYLNSMGYQNIVKLVMISEDPSYTRSNMNYIYTCIKEMRDCDIIYICDKVQEQFPGIIHIINIANDCGIKIVYESSLTQQNIDKNPYDDKTKKSMITNEEHIHQNKQDLPLSEIIKNITQMVNDRLGISKRILLPITEANVLDALVNCVYNEITKSRSHSNLISHK